MHGGKMKTPLVVIRSVGAGLLRTNNQAALYSTVLRRMTLLGVIVAVGVTIRVWNLNKESPYGDEIVSLQHLNAPDLATFLSRERHDDLPMTPLYFTIEYYWDRLAGGSLPAMRCLSLIFAAATMLMIYVLGSALYDTTAGLVASVCAALSISQIYYAVEVRPYALVILLALVSGYALWRGLHEGKRRWWALNVAANILIMWAHLFATLFIFGQGCYLLAHWAREKTSRSFPSSTWERAAKPLLLWGGLQAPSVLLLFQWVRSINFAEFEVAAQWRDKMVHTYLMPLGDFLLFCGAGVPTFRDVTAFGGQHMGGIMWRIFLPILLCVFAATLYRWWRRQPGQERTMSAAGRQEAASGDAFCFLFPWLVIPSAALFLISAGVYACHSSRYVIYGSIPFLIFVGAAVSFLRRPALQILAVTFLISLYSFNLYAHPGPWRHDFKSAAAFLQTHMSKRDTLVFYHLSGGLGLEYSMTLSNSTAGGKDGNEPGSGVLPATVKGMREFTELLAYVNARPDLASAAPIWLFISHHRDLEPETKQLEQAFGRNGQSVSKWQFGYVRPIILYRMAPRAPVQSIPSRRRLPTVQPPT